MPKLNYIQKVLSAGLGVRSSNSNLKMRSSNNLYPEVTIQQPIKKYLPQFVESWDSETEIEKHNEEVLSNNILKKDRELEPGNINQKPNTDYRERVLKETSPSESEFISNQNQENSHSGREDQKGKPQEEIIEKRPEIEGKHIEEKNVNQIGYKLKDKLPEVEIIKEPTIKEKENKSTLSRNIQNVPGEQQVPKPTQDIPKALEKKDLKTNSDLKELKTDQIYEPNEETPLVVKMQEKASDTKRNVIVKSSKTEMIGNIKDKTDGSENLKVQSEGQKTRKQKKSTFVASDVKEKKTEYKPDILDKSIKIIQSPKREDIKIQSQEQKTIHRKDRDIIYTNSIEKITEYKPDVSDEPIKIIQRPQEKILHLNTNFYTESLKKERNQMSKITNDIATLEERLATHIRNEHSKPRRSVFLPKRPPSRNLGGWNYLERNYLK